MRTHARLGRWATGWVHFNKNRNSRYNGISKNYLWETNRNCSFSKSSLPVIKRLLGNKSRDGWRQHKLWEFKTGKAFGTFLPKSVMRLASKFFLPHELGFPGAPWPACAWETVAFTLRPNNHSSLSWHLSQLFLTVMHVFLLKGEYRSRTWDISFGWVMWLRIWKRMYTGYLLFKLYKIKLDFKG